MPNAILNSAIPGFDTLTGSASDIVKNALSGLPSTANARLQNAYFGAGTGLDSRSGFLTNRGFDL